MSATQTTTNIQTYIAELVQKAKVAQKHFEHNYKTQRSVDEVVRAAGKAIVDNGAALAGDAVAETGMGNIEGKVGKLNLVALRQWNFVRGKPSVGYIDVPDEPGVRMIPKPLGVIGCVMPSTNPIATVVGNTMMAFKCRNAVIIAPHPASAKASLQTSQYIREGLEKIGAPADLIQCIDLEHASIEATSEMLKQCDVNIATGGAGMVKAVYSSGRPAFGVGQGNCQEIIDEDWEDMAGACVAAVNNRFFDLGAVCTGDQTMHVPAAREEEYLSCMRAAGAYIIEDPAMIDKVRDLIFPNGGEMLNRKTVGRTAQQLGEMLGIDVPEGIKVLTFKVQAKGREDVLCKEILCPMLRYTTYTKFEDAADRAVANLEYEGAGHSSSIWSTNQERIDYVAERIPVGRFHINQPTAGAKNGIPSTITIGCGSWGNNSICENLEYYHLMNKTRVSVPLQNMREHSAADWDDFSPAKFYND